MQLRGVSFLELQEFTARKITVTDQSSTQRKEHGRNGRNLEKQIICEQAAC